MKNITGHPDEVIIIERKTFKKRKRVFAIVFSVTFDKIKEAEKRKNELEKETGYSFSVIQTEG